MATTHYYVAQVGPDGVEDEPIRHFDNKEDAQYYADSVVRALALCGFIKRGTYSKGVSLVGNGDIVARTVTMGRVK